MNKCPIKDKSIWNNIMLNCFLLSLILIGFMVAIYKESILVMVISYVGMWYVFVMNFWNGYKLGWLYHKEVSEK